MAVTRVCGSELFGRFRSVDGSWGTFFFAAKSNAIVGNLYVAFSSRRIIYLISHRRASLPELLVVTFSIALEPICYAATESLVQL